MASRYSLRRLSLKRFWRDERGATAIEYGLLVALIFLAIVGSLSAFGSQTDGMYQVIQTTISTYL